MAVESISYLGPLNDAVQTLLKDGRTNNSDYEVRGYEDELEDLDGFKRLVGRFRDKPIMLVNIETPTAIDTDTSRTKYLERCPITILCAVSDIQDFERQKYAAMNLCHVAQKHLSGTVHEYTMTNQSVIEYDGMEPFMSVKGGSVLLANFHIDFNIGHD